MTRARTVARQVMLATCQLVLWSACRCDTDLPSPVRRVPTDTFVVQGVLDTVRITAETYCVFWRGQRHKAVAIIREGRVESCGDGCETCNTYVRDTPLAIAGGYLATTHDGVSVWRGDSAKPRRLVAKTTGPAQFAIGPAFAAWSVNGSREIGWWQVDYERPHSIKVSREPTRLGVSAEGDAVCVGGESWAAMVDQETSREVKLPGCRVLTTACSRRVGASICADNRLVSWSWSDGDISRLPVRRATSGIESLAVVGKCVIAAADDNPSLVTVVVGASRSFGLAMLDSFDVTSGEHPPYDLMALRVSGESLMVQRSTSLDVYDLGSSWMRECFE